MPTTSPDSGQPSWNKSNGPFWNFTLLKLLGLLSVTVLLPCLALDIGCSYDESQFNNETICDFDVDLSGDESSAPYAHCRIILGYVYIRHILLPANTSSNTTNNGSAVISFPNLEIIRDFLMIHNIYSENRLESNEPLNQIFPNLRQILGHTRLYSFSLFFSQYNAGSQIDINKLEKVCGAIMIPNSTGICFRHSDTYWRIASNYVGKQHHNLFARIDRNDILDRSVTETGVVADLRAHINLPISKVKQVEKVFFSIFDIDPSYYDYIQSGKQISSGSCSDKIYANKTFMFSDLTESSVLNYKDMLAVLRQSVNQPIATSPLKQYLWEAPEPSPLANPIWGLYFDIPDMHNVDGKQLEGNYAFSDENYTFLWSHIYLIRVAHCFSQLHSDCVLANILFFEPNPNDFGSFTYNPTPLWPIALLLAVIFLSISIALLTNRKSLFRLYIQYRLKSLSRVEVISVNPEYSLVNSLNLNEVWSSWSPFSRDPSSSLFENVSCEINRSMLTILPEQLLGSGEFGVVHKGHLRYGFDAANAGAYSGQNQTTGHQLPNGDLMLVAIKQLKDNARLVDKERFIVEAKYMKTFESNFLVKLIGICTVEEPILVVMEFLDNGDLKHYLRQRHVMYRDTYNVNVLPSKDSLIQMAIQVADGMHYLHSKNIIHRDLAARNCMVATDLQVKIGDFGLTRLLYERDYYRLSEETPMPLRWMAPESVRKMIFTPATDVWSYGVLLWEIMSLGEQPYKGTPDLEVKQMIINCVKLKPPAFFIPVMWDIAKLCWQKNSNSRPNFRQIIETLYPHLGPNQPHFDQLSFYVSSRQSIHRNSGSSASSSNSGCSHHHPHQQRCSFSSLVLQCQCFGWMFRRSSTNHSDDRQCAGQNGCPFYHRQLTTTSTQSSQSSQSALHDRAHSCSRGHHPRRNRCLSIDSIQSADCSEITTITSISTN